MADTHRRRQAAISVQYVKAALFGLPRHSYIPATARGKQVRSYLRT